ncbi:hypothetical protein BJ138DRAFT_1161857 [Hygrophoropsis aurantiaca]|uniref:Uncharacterized protein n=1 Tax=Hygrophoropsis aurantiaca TaxID=72124 RepID=A0ACB8A0D4_9AGAM|nr:hypothetical protein BJ138DRAFT_1161857 [Hygrophoropsis aurantiaca]
MRDIREMCNIREVAGYKDIQESAFKSHQIIFIPLYLSHKQRFTVLTSKAANFNMFSSKFIAAALIVASGMQISNGLVFRRDDEGMTGSMPPETMTTSHSSHLTQSTGTESTKSSASVTQTATSSMETKTIESSSFSGTTSNHTTQTHSIPSTQSHEPSKSSETASSSPTSSHSGKPPKPTGSMVDCDHVLEWERDTAYTSGSQTVYTDELWTAKQWSYNNSPNDAAMEWTLNGSCMEPKHSVTVSCFGIAAWNKQAMYEAGSKVTYGGHLWSAPHWVSSNVPGDTSGSWVDQGVCKD